MSEKKIWEIVYLYEVENANPNGDPLMDNRPRYDDEMEVALVSDVRIKRWIRDYILSKYGNQQGKMVYVREERDEKGKLLTRKNLLVKDLSNKNEKLETENIINTYIDIRLFGATLSIKDRDERSLIGPVQFRMGKSLNKAEILQFQGTTVFPTGKEKTQGSPTEWWGIRYGIFSVYGVVNFNNNKTNISKDDVKIMLEALTNLFSVDSAITRSKVGHRLIGIILVKGDKYIGNLDDYIALEKDRENITYNVDQEGVGKKISPRDNIKLNITRLVEVVEKRGGEIRVLLNDGSGVKVEFNGEVSKVNSVEELME